MPNHSDAPASDYFAVVPSDTVGLVRPARCLYVGVAGDVTVTGLDGVKVVWTALANGWHPICCTRVWATGTTATNINAIA